MAKTQTKAGGDIVGACLLFEKPGPANTKRTLEWAAKAAKERSIENVLIATASGATAVDALRYFDPSSIVAVTHSTGFTRQNFQELKAGNRKALEAAGVRILTCQHAFGGVGRAVRKKLGTYELEEIIAYSLRTFGQGTKVAVEIALMAADAGLVPTGVPCLSIGGTETGADTVLLLAPTTAQAFFDLRVLEVLAKPRALP